ncbi:MAG: hypothetical protein V4438_04355 [Patescibacteria group bacterium]
MTKPKSKERIAKLSKVEKAIVYLAEMMQDPMHDQYRIRAQVIDILGYEWQPLPSTKPKR